MTTGKQNKSSEFSRVTIGKSSKFLPSNIKCRRFLVVFLHARFLLFCLANMQLPLGRVSPVLFESCCTIKRIFALPSDVDVRFFAPMDFGLLDSLGAFRWGRKHPSFPIFPLSIVVAPKDSNSSAITSKKHGDRFSWNLITNFSLIWISKLHVWRSDWKQFDLCNNLKNTPETNFSKITRAIVEVIFTVGVQ